MPPPNSLPPNDACPEGTPLTLSAPLVILAEAGTAPGSRRQEYAVRFIRAGQITLASGEPGPFVVPPEAIHAAVDAGMFTGLPSFVDHPGWFENHSLRNLAGTSQSSQWNEADESADGVIRLYDTAAGAIVDDLLAGILADLQAGDPVPDVGLSLTFYPRWKPRDNADAPRDDPLVLAAFRKILSADFVFAPAAGGRVKEALEALSALGQTRGQQMATNRPNPPISQSIDPQEVPMPPETETPTPCETPAEPAAAETARHPRESGEACLRAPSEAWLQSLAHSATQALIAASGLPPAIQTHLRGQPFATPDEVTAAIEAQRQLLASLQQDQVVQIGNVPPRSSGVTFGPTGLEQVTAAFEALVAGTQPPSGIQPLTGIRELYHILSGDYEMTGLFQAERIHLANVTSATMAGLVANALNKVVVNMFQAYPLWWQGAITEMDFTTLQDVRWITLGGVGELPTVAEGAAYTELTWDDQTETDAFIKKGGYLGITLEAIDKDDTRRLQAAPRALAQAAWLTLGKAISAIFTDASGTGPLMSDSVRLFDASGHGNLLTTALSWAQWNTVKVAMMKQAEVHSGERLGALTRPYYLWVPVDLETTALQILASEGEPGTGDNDVNPDATGNDRETRLANARRRLIVCPLWTDTNNWAAQADPRLYPSLGVGYRYGRTPEIFSVASPTAGLMFTNDTMPVKVRFFFAVGPIDYRGLHKSNVA